jgi:hypothetical protein
MLGSTRRLRAVTMVVVLAAFAGTGLASASAAQAPDPFVGSWTSIDTDGSHQTFDVFGNDRVHRVVLFDDAATGACGGLAATARGFGIVHGNHLQTLLNLSCEGGGRLTNIPLGFDYDAATDTLLDSFGVVWFRA